MKYALKRLNFTCMLGIFSLTAVMASPDETEQERQRPAQVFMTSQASPQHIKALEAKWEAGDVIFVDTYQKPLPFSRQSLTTGELLPLGRFCVQGESFPPKGYNPLTDMGFYGEDGICGPFAQGSNRLIQNPYTAHSDTQGQIRYNYRELFVDSTGSFWLGMQVFVKRTFMLNKIRPGNAYAFKNVIVDFVASRDMTLADFTRGLEESLGVQRFQAVLGNYPELRKAADGSPDL